MDLYVRYYSIANGLQEGLCAVHTTPEEFENAALFLWLCLPSAPIRHENGALRKRSSNRRNLKTPVLRFSVNEKHFENEPFLNDDVTIIMIFPCPSFPQTQMQMTGDWCVFKFLRRSVNGTRLTRQIPPV